MPTTFIPVPGTPEGVKRMLDRSPMPLVLVSRHGLGDNLFFSPCFQPLQSLFGQLYFCSSVNAYASIFHDSDIVQVLYAGGVNGSELGLSSALGFCRHFERIGLDLDVPAALVYHFGLFEPQLPYNDERAFVKGRRNYVELFETGPFAIDVPRYHAAPDGAAQGYIARVIDRWLPQRELIAIARYGHTDGGKNFGDDWRDTLRTVELLDERFPGRFKYLSLDYTPGDHAADGHAPHVRSVYGFLPCDAGSMHHLLSCARLLITVPSGPMLVGATVRGLKLLTLWKTMPPYHFLDPQFGAANPVHALVEREDLSDTAFMDGWPALSREAVRRRWRVRVGAIDPESVAQEASLMLESP